MFQCLSLVMLAVSLDWENDHAYLFPSWDMHFIRLVTQNINTVMWLRSSKDCCQFIHRPSNLIKSCSIRKNYIFMIFKGWRLKEKTSNWLKMKQPGNWFSAMSSSGWFVRTVSRREGGMYTANLTWGSPTTSNSQVKLSFVSSCLPRYCGPLNRSVDTDFELCSQLCYWLWATHFISQSSFVVSNSKCIFDWIHFEVGNIILRTGSNVVKVHETLKAMDMWVISTNDTVFVLQKDKL